MYEKVVLIIFGSIFLILSIFLVLNNFKEIINSETITYQTCYKQDSKIYSFDENKCKLGDMAGILTKPAYTIIYWAALALIAGLLCFVKAFRFNKLAMFLAGLFTSGLGLLFTFIFNNGSFLLTIASIILLILGALLTIWGVKRIFSTG